MAGVGLDVPLPIAYLTTSLQTEGPATMLVELALRLDPRRFEPIVIQLSPPADAPLARRLEAAGIELTSVGGGPAAVWHLTRLLRRRRPAILHTRLIRADFLGRLAGRAAGVPVLTNLCDIYSRHFDDLHGRRRGRWLQAIDRATIPLAARVVTNGVGVRDDLLAHGIRVPEEVAVISNGVDVERYRRDAATGETIRETLGIPATAWVVGTVGRLWPQKRHDVLVAAVPELIARCPSAHVLLVGDGELRQQLEAQVRDRGLTAHVHLLGRRPDIPAVLSAMDVFAFPSDPEGCPNAVLEAMSAELAVVGANVQGTRELVVDGETGALVPPGDAGLLAQALLAYSDRAAARAAGRRARARVEAHFTFDVMVSRFQHVYDQILARPA